MRFRVRALAAALACTAACGNQQDVTATLQGQDEGGTPLSFGFTTVPGTALQGPVFPQPLRGSPGFVAVMTLTGDPTEVYDAFASQAARMGYQVQSAKQACTFSSDDGLLYAPDGNAVDWTERPEDADILFCGTTADLHNDDDFTNAAYVQLAISPWYWPCEMGRERPALAATSPSWRSQETSPLSLTPTKTRSRRTTSHANRRPNTRLTYAGTTLRGAATTP